MKFDEIYYFIGPFFSTRAHDEVTTALERHACGFPKMYRSYLFDSKHHSHRPLSDIIQVSKEPRLTCSDEYITGVRR